MIRFVFATTAASLVLATAVSAQSFNIDFGDAAGAPPSDYGAAGQPGVWNVIVPQPETGSALVDLNGQPIPVTLALIPFVEAGVFDDPATGGAEEQILDDHLPGLGDVTVSLDFQGLANGTYEVITYGWVPGAPEQGSTIFMEPDAKFNGQIIGGPWPGGLEQGVTHSVHLAEVVDGTLLVSMIGSYWWTSGVYNAIQFRHIGPAFAEADLNEDGQVDVNDLIIVLLNWTTPGHGCDGVNPCEGDINHDDLVDVEDLVLVIGQWTG